MKKLPKVLAVIAAWPLLLAMLLTSVVFVSFTPQFYFREYDVLHQEAAIGCERATLDNITITLVEYMKGNVPNLHMQAVIGSDVREVFSERDKQHMVDVKYLFDMAVYGAVVGAILFAVLIVCSILLGTKGLRARTVSRGLLWGCAGFFVVAGGLAAYIALDFSGAFVSFHHIFFNNDLWMLPSDSVLLMIMPQEFFVHMATYIGAIFAAMLAVPVLAAGLMAILTRRSRAKEALQAEVPLCAEGPVAAVIAQDGERYVITSEQNDERPGTDDIFESFGLSDKDDQPLMPDEAQAQTAAPAAQEHPPAPILEEAPRTALASFSAFSGSEPLQEPVQEPVQVPEQEPVPEPAQEALAPQEREDPFAQEGIPFTSFAAFAQETPEGIEQEILAPQAEPAPEQAAPVAPFASSEQEPEQEAPAPLAEPAPEQAMSLAPFAEETVREAPAPIAVPVEVPLPSAVQPCAVTPLAQALPMGSDGVLRLQLRLPAAVLSQAAQGQGMELVLEVGEQDNVPEQAVPAARSADAPAAPRQGASALNPRDMASVLALMDEIMLTLPYDTAE